MASLPEGDIFIGSGEFQNIHDILKKSYGGSAEKRFFNLPTYLQEDHRPRVNSEVPHRAYLKISEGCKKRCAFCSIPNIRGNLQSRTIESVVLEAKSLVANGAKELIIISHEFYRLWMGFTQAAGEAYRPQASLKGFGGGVWSTVDSCVVRLS